MGRDAAMAMRYLATVASIAVVVAEEPRKLGLSIGDVSYSSNGVSNSPFGQVNNMMNQAKEASQQAMEQAKSKMVQPGQTGGADSFTPLSNDPFGGDPFSSFGNTPKSEEAKGFALSPQNGAVVLQGMIHSFLAHKQLQKGEMQCLEQGTSAMGSQAAAVAQNIVMIGQQVMSVQNVGDGPGDMPGMPALEDLGTKAPTADQKLDNANDMFDQMFGSGGSGGSSSSSDQGAKAPPNPFDMFKGLVHQGSPPAAAPAAAPAPQSGTNNVQTNMNLWTMGQGRRLQMGMMGMGGGGMGGMPGMGGAGGGNSMDPMMMMGGAAMATQLAKQLQDLAGLGHKVMARCLKGDLQHTLHIAAARAQNPAWLQKAMIGNGPKALGHVADGIEAYHDGDVEKFGDSVGIVMREMLLNNPNSVLPEGLPDDKTLFNVTGGFMKGFFGPGMTATIKTPEEPNGINIALDKCIGKNIGLLQGMWASVMKFYARKGLPSSAAEQQQDATLLAYAAAQMPRALKMCNLGAEDVQALKDAIAGMGKGVDVSFTVPKPDSAFGKTEAVTDMAKTVSGYQQLVQDPSTGIDFGKQLGGIFQKVVENGFAQKYYVDKSGNLRRRILQLRGSGGPFQGSESFIPAVLVLVVFFLLLVLVAIKSRRAFAGWKEHLCQMECTESGAAEKMISHPDDLDTECQEIQPILDEVQ